MRGVEIAYLLNKNHESTYDLLNGLYEILEEYPIKFKPEILYESELSDFSLIAIRCYLEEIDEDNDYDEISQTSFTSYDSPEKLVNYILSKLLKRK